MKGGHLATLDGKPHMERILTLLQNVAHGMVYLHDEKGIMHGDLSLANVLIQVRLISSCVEVVSGGAACPYSLGLEVSRLCGMSRGFRSRASNSGFKQGCEFRVSSRLAAHALCAAELATVVSSAIKMQGWRDASVRMPVNDTVRQKHSTLAMNR